jgi:hypothetical protein
VEINVSALEATLSEIKNACSGVSNMMVLDSSNQVIAKDQNASDELVSQVSGSFEKILKQSAIVGGIESLTFKGSFQSIFFNRHEDIYLATVASNQVTQKEINRLTHVLFPTTLKVLQEVVSINEEDTVAQEQVEVPKPKNDDAVVSEVIPEKANVPKQELQMDLEPEATLNTPVDVQVPDVPQIKCRVENVSGFSIVFSSDNSVFLDRALIGEWKERWGNNSIEEVSVSDVDSKKTMLCKFKPIKNSKLEGKGAVQISHNLQKSLGLNQGSHVLVKPVIK